MGIEFKKIPINRPILVKQGRIRVNKNIFKVWPKLSIVFRDHSGSVVECLTRDRGAACSSLSGVTVSCP